MTLREEFPGIVERQRRAEQFQVLEDGVFEQYSEHVQYNFRFACSEVDHANGNITGGWGGY
jgi:hypothetical protein